jgi:hypothetical protein
MVLLSKVEAGGKNNRGHMADIPRIIFFREPGGPGGAGSGIF